jgi:molybdenum cofactor cytidylyltransferase
MPGLSPKVVKSILDAQIDDHTIVAPVYYREPARRGHPVLFGAAHRPALEALSKDEGANSVVLDNTLHLELVAVDHGLADIDLPTDL